MDAGGRTYRRRMAYAASLMTLGLVCIGRGLLDKNPINRALEHGPPVTWTEFVTYGWTQLGLAMLAIGAVGTIGFGVAWFMSPILEGLDVGQALLRRRATRALGPGTPSELRIRRKMLELEEADGGWQLATIRAYLEEARRDRTRIDTDLMEAIAAWCREARAAGEDAVAEGGSLDPPITWAGVDQSASGLVTEAENTAELLRKVRYRDE